MKQYFIHFKILTAVYDPLKAQSLVVKYPLVYLITTCLIWIFAKPLDVFDLCAGTDKVLIVWHNYFSLWASISEMLLHGLSSSVLYWLKKNMFNKHEMLWFPCLLPTKDVFSILVML